LADVALDTWTVNGHTTTSDALWSGVPVITRIGGHFASRVAASVLNAMGLSMLITHSAQEYAQLAITLAKEPKVLRHLRAQLKTNRIRCPLFDTQRFVKNLESAYLTMWQRHQAGRAPDSFDVVDNATKQAQIHVPKCGTCFCDSTDNQEWRRGK
jgi:predicted O-linked N-acetylglucosamine transferase (SPINDLY family)